MHSGHVPRTCLSMCVAVTVAAGVASPQQVRSFRDALLRPRDVAARVRRESPRSA